MSVPNQGQSAAKRITCKQCGANNYVGGTHCWQCGKPLDQNAQHEPPAAGLPAASAHSASSAYSTSGTGQLASGYSTAPSAYPAGGSAYNDPPIIAGGSMRPVQPIILPGEHVDPDLAPKAAAALGLMFPIFAIPAGIIFLMLDDARKVRLGWITIWWSVGGSVIGFILSLMTLGPFMGALHALIPHGGGGGGNPLQSLSSPDLSGGQ